MPQKSILLAHGSGGRLTHDLIRDIFVRHFDNPLLATQDDAAVPVLPASSPTRLAFSTDSYVVQPIFFPGGDIGKLAVCGTVNDLSMVGARPLYLSAGFILEEGLPVSDLERVVASMALTAADAGVQVVTGDTKVVDRGKCDQVFVNTAGVGLVPQDTDISGANARPGDAVILSGPIGMHGLAVMCQREGLRFSLPLASDCAPLNGLVQAMLNADSRIHCLRDPTRGGLATALHELASQSNVGIDIEETSIAIPDSVRAGCEILGLDPLYVANEGKLVAIASPEAESALLSAMREHPYGRQAAVIGRVTSEHPGRVVLRTSLGARRILDMLTGAQLPRIC